MTYDRIITAYRALLYLRTVALPARKARAVFDIKQALETGNTFYGEEETKLVERFAEKNKDGQPRVEGVRVFFARPQDRYDYDTAVIQLRETQAQVEFTPLALSLDEMGDQVISAETIEALRGIVDID